MEEWRGYFNLSGDDLKSLAFHVSNANGPGQRSIRYFYALGDIEGLNEDTLVLPGSLGVIGTGGFVTQVVWFYWGLELISIFIDELV